MTKRWHCDGNICYGCADFLESTPKYWPRCRKGSDSIMGRALVLVPDDCPRINKFERQYDIPCKCGKVGVAYPVGSNIHIFCKHCGWGIDADGQPSYYIGVDTLNFYPFMCGQLLRRIHRKGVPFVVPKRCRCGGIPVIEYSNPNWKQPADPDYYVQCNTCRYRLYLHDCYSKSSNYNTWDEEMASRESEKKLTQPERSLSNDKKVYSLERQARKYKDQVKQLKDDVSVLAEEKAQVERMLPTKAPRRIIRRRGV